MSKQTQKVWSRETAITLCGAIRRPIERLNKLASEGRKIPNADVVKALADIKKPLKELEELAIEGGRMPASLRKHLTVTCKRLRDTEIKLRSWAITTVEHVQKTERSRK